MPQGQTILNRRREMDPGIDPALGRLGRRIGKVVELARDPGQGDTRGREGLFAEEVGQNGGRGGAEGGMPGDIVGMVRGREKRNPARVGRGGGIPVRVGQPDRRDRTPGAVGVLGIPGRDGGVRERDIQLGQQSRTRCAAETLGCGHPGRDLVPMARRRVAAGTVSPEQRNLGLVSTALAGGGRAQPLHLVELRRVRGAGDVGGTVRAKLIPAAPGRRASPSPIAATAPAGSREASGATRRALLRRHS